MSWRPHLLLLPLALGLAGCQPYRPSPLDLAGHEARWAARDPASADVATYARRLATLGRSQTDAFNAADGLSVREAEAVALFFNARLRAARLKARAPLLGAREAGRWEDPELGVDAERILESVEHPWVLGGMLNFTIPLSGRLEVEKSKAFAEAEAELLRAYAEEAAVLAELRTAWAEWSATRQRVELATQYLKDLDEVLNSAEALLRAREIAATDVRTFRVERVTRQAELKSREIEQRQGEAAVKGLMGLVPEAGVMLLPSLETRPAASATSASPTSGRIWLRENHPRMLLARAEHMAAEKALELEIRRQYPDLTLGGGLGTEDGDPRVLFGARLPLAVFNRNRRAIAEARASRDAAKAAAEARYEELAGQLFRAELSAEAARHQRDLLQREVVPLVDEQVAELRRLGRLGDFNTLVLLEALRTSYEAKVQLLEAVLKEATAVNELDALSAAGTPPRAGEKAGQR
jgi:outer membrane protein, heavy metal efflux system